MSISQTEIDRLKAEVVVILEESRVDGRESLDRVALLETYRRICVRAFDALKVFYGADWERVGVTLDLVHGMLVESDGPENLDLPHPLMQRLLDRMGELQKEFNELGEQLIKDWM